MPALIYPGIFTFCPRVVNSFEEGYYGSLPLQYQPIEFSNLENAMDMFWRVKSWRVNMTRTTTITLPAPSPPPESYSFVCVINGLPEITSPEGLVCRQFLSWSFSGTAVYGIFPDEVTVNYSAGLSISNDLFLFEGKYYLPLSVGGHIGPHTYSSTQLSDTVNFLTEYTNTDFTVVSAPATFQILDQTNDLIPQVETAFLSEVSNVSCSIQPEEYWDYSEFQ